MRLVYLLIFIILPLVTRRIGRTVTFPLYRIYGGTCSDVLLSRQHNSSPCLGVEFLKNIRSLELRLVVIQDSQMTLDNNIRCKTAFLWLSIVFIVRYYLKTIKQWVFQNRLGGINFSIFVCFLDIWYRKKYFDWFLGPPNHFHWNYGLLLIKHTFAKSRHLDQNMS